MRQLLCDSGPLIASFDRSDRYHASCIRLLAEWPGELLIPEPVLGETCNFLRNHVRSGPALELQFLDAVAEGSGDFTIINPTDEDRRRATGLVRQLVAAPLGYVDASIVALAERLKVTEIATVDFKLLGMASQVSEIKPLRWVLQEGRAQ
ncbi:MAG: type II toxin-antitoxin system VapC family toxin [Micromonosporaceae bacterium]